MGPGVVGQRHGRGSDYKGQLKVTEATTKELGNGSHSHVKEIVRLEKELSIVKVQAKICGDIAKI